MTPKEKAERYDEALRRARKLKENPTSVFYEYSPSKGDTIADYIFPELKESEDEKVRKAIIDTIKSLKEQQCHHIYGVIYDKMIAWLEKQGRHTNFRNKIRIGDKVTRNENGELVNLSQLNRVAKKIEKQSEQKPQGKTAFEAINEEKVDNANKVEPKDYSSIDPHFGKSIDKVEPKFYEGQWIVWQDKYYKINYNGCGYELVDQNGLNTSLEYGTINENAHLFTIEDAKDGDVLINNNENFPFIFKQLEPCDIKTDIKNPLAVLGYCGIGGAGFTKGEGWGDTVNCTYYPATKEQRDKLEKAMADEGYTFDFERKELKKIKDEIEIPFGAKDSELIAESYYIPKGFHAEIDGDKVVVKKGEKPTWSEMDKAITRAISSNLELLKNIGGGEVNEAAYQSEIKWLKALKRRVGYDEEWSEEDVYRTEKLLGWLSALINYIHDDAMVSLDLRRERIQQVEQIKTWFVSLKDRIQPKNDYNPYKEVVESIAKMCERYDKYSHSILKDFFNNVKAKCKDAKEFDSLHPQNTKAISQ